MALKCEQCDKSFDSKESFEQHNQAKHQKNKDVAETSKKGLGIKKKHVVLTITLVTVLAFSFWVYSFSTGPGKYDDFAKCLTEKDTKFYGAFWCPNCEQQKAVFGKSVKFVPYIECSPPDQRGQLEVCRDAEIESYPTWEFSDGSRLTGFRSLETLSSKSGCSLGGE